MLPTRQQIVAMALVEAALRLYIISMDDFLAYIRRRQAELKKELAELDTAEAVYRRSGARMVTAQAALPITPPPRTEKLPAIKEMILAVLAEAGFTGLSAINILDRIRERWHPDMARTTLSPQLSRLKVESQIVNQDRVWKLADFGEPPDETEAPASTEASETDGAGID